MKKIIIITIAAFFQFVYLNAQTTVKENPNISEIRRIEEKIDSIISIINTNNSNEKELKNILIKNEDLQNENTSLISQLEELKNVRDENNKIKEDAKNHNEKINKLNQTIKQNKDEIRNLKINQEAAKKEGINEGKSLFLNEYTKDFQNKSIDEIIILYSLERVQMDIRLLKENHTLIEKLKAVEQYYLGKELLSNKYNKIETPKVVKELRGVNSALSKEIADNLEYYKETNDKLVEIVNNLISNNPPLRLFGDEKIKEKYNNIINVLSDFIYNYEISSNSYPYLLDIITEIITIKKTNIDADLTTILNKL